jgi:type I restriction enzyme S subunit
MALVTSFLGSVFRGHLARFEQVPLGELCYFENGDRSANYPSKSVRTSTGVPFINAGHMVDDGIDMTSMDFIPRDRFDLLSNGKTKPGDILFCLRGSLGKCTCVGDLPEGAIASSLVIVRPGERVLGSYVLAFLRSPLCSELVDRFKNGAAQPNLSARSLKKFPVPVPPLEEQATVVRAVRRLQERAHCVELLGRWRRMAIDALHASLLEGALT